MSELDLTIVIPTYNSISKMSETLESLEKTLQLVKGEAVFVDDCSSDGTYEKLNELASKQENWKVFRMPENSGSAAAPRNFGIEEAQGNWIYFLDSDDILEPRAMAEALENAIRYKYDVVRTSLKVRMGDGSERIGDLIPKWDSIKDPVARIRAITKHQSLTCSCFVKRQIILENDVRFDVDRRIGEDIKFTSEVLLNSQRIGYRATPARTYVRNSVGEESVTQKLSSNQFADFVKSWNEVEDNLAELGISFVAEHGFSAVQYALRQFVWFRSEDLERSVFELFSDFCNRHKASLRSFPFESRYLELVDAALVGDYEEFCEAVKLRVLIAGHDLKFMGAIEQRMRESYHVKLDRWDGHTEHDEKQSRSLLSWADFVWVEWLLGASVWYSKRIRGDQRMVVRAHRSEVVADYGLQINRDKVSAVITIAPHVMGDFADRFDLPREKMWVIPNALDIESYERGTYTEKRLGKIAMVGTVPKLKGFKKCLEMFASLRKEFPELELHVYGKDASELDWVWNNPEETEYFRSCERFIEEQSLENHVVRHGWVDTKKSLSEVCAVVSMSDFEGMQVSVAEGYCSGGLGLTLGWRGAEQGFPKEWVFDDVDAMESALREVLAGRIDLQAASSEGRALMSELYSVQAIWPYIDELMKAVRA
ncbi:glycosyltransferase [Corynebacterium minutissimum]